MQIQDFKFNEINQFLILKKASFNLSVCEVKALSIIEITVKIFGDKIFKKQVMELIILN